VQPGPSGTYGIFAAMALFPSDLLFTLAAAAFGTAAAVVALEFLAGAMRLIDHPGEHRNHERPVPLVGGLAIFAGLVLAFAVSGKPALVFLAPALLLVGMLPHALPELCALFLPLAAWSVAGRRGQWNDLLAATLVTTALAAPVLLVAGAVEVWVTPHVLYFLK